MASNLRVMAHNLKADIQGNSVAPVSNSFFVTTSKALVTTSMALVPSSLLFLIASCY